ncbi:MAG: insulinase family protein [Paludibacteraceae bacterium]|nr:insulinase family protein [Paludibacteraceae bacterium]
MNINTYILKSGIRLLHVKAVGDVAYCGAVINTGTRDELPTESGYAHLVEHMLFKGTSKFSSNQIISRMEDVGGEMNAYTTKEETVVYAAFMSRYLDRCFSLVSDMVLDSQFDERNLKKETEVVLEEIDSYIDNPAELIMDEFENLIYSGNPLGRNILGDRKTLRSVSRKRIMEFYKRTYTPDQIVFFVMGNYTPQRILSLSEKRFEGLEPKTRSYTREELAPYTPQFKEVRKHTRQVHFVMGNRSYSYAEKERFTFILLNHILGGEYMSCILNMSLREKEGLVYDVCSNYTTYADTGNWNIYLGCDYDKLNHVTDIIYSELGELMEMPISERELKLAKVRLLSYLTIGGENRESWILGTAKQYLNTGRVMEKHEVESLINSVTAADIQRCAEQIFAPERITTLKFV